MNTINIIFKILIISTNLLCARHLVSVAQLIPRTFLFNAPKYFSLSINPNGKTIAYLAANDLGISNIYTKCLICKYAIQVTFEKKQHIIRIFLSLLNII